MAIKSFKVKFTGFAPMLQNNAQTVDIFNHYAKQKATITKKRTKTDEDILALRIIEVESKVHWNDKQKVVIPQSWLLSSLAKNSFKQAKISKDNIRGSVFVVESCAKLNYDGMEVVKELSDISRNERFTRVLILPQQQVRLTKAFPIFHDWNFTFTIEYDDRIVDTQSLITIIEYGAKYNGFGDFRPTYGRAVIEVIND